MGNLVGIPSIISRNGNEENPRFGGTNDGRAQGRGRQVTGAPGSIDRHHLQSLLGLQVDEAPNRLHSIVDEDIAMAGVPRRPRLGGLVAKRICRLGAVTIHAPEAT